VVAGPAANPSGTSNIRTGGLQAAAAPDARIEHGRALFRTGKVLSARERFLSAVADQPALVLLELARTFDPHYLEKITTADGRPEPHRARSLYEEAMRRGSKAAADDLKRISASLDGKN
jgi:hypothetical protein